MATTKHSAYPKYKPSGVEWLGEIPEHWGLDRLKWTIVNCTNGIWGSDPEGTSDDIVCVRVADFNRVTFRVNAGCPTLRALAAQERFGRILSKGDLLLEKSGGGELQPVGAVVIYDQDTPAVCSNFVARMAARDTCDPRFLTRRSRNQDLCTFMLHIGGGDTVCYRDDTIYRTTRRQNRFPSLLL